jgi:hypothetical protein
LIAIKLKLMSMVAKALPIIFGAAPILVLSDEPVTTTGLWRMAVTALMSIIGVLLGVIYRDWRRRLEQAETRVSRQGQALELLLALSVSLHPEESERVLSTFKEITKLLKD